MRCVAEARCIEGSKTIAHLGHFASRAMFLPG
jgi:hypothetical protein